MYLLNQKIYGHFNLPVITVLTLTLIHDIPGTQGRIDMRVFATCSYFGALLGYIKIKNLTFNVPPAGRNWVNLI